MKRIHPNFQKSVLLFLIGLLLFLPNVVKAQSQTGVSLTAQAGFDGYCKENSWIPVRVIIENQGDSMQGRLEAHLASLMTNEPVFAQTISLPTISRKETFLNVPAGRYSSDLKIDLFAGEKIIASKTIGLTCLSQGDWLVGVMAESPSVFNVFSEIKPPNGRTSIAQLQPDDIPQQGLALQALDILIISNVDSGLLDTRQREALSSWVANGGQLIVTGGLNWQKTAAGLNGLMPLNPESTQSIPNLDGLAGYSDVPDALSGETFIAKGVLQSGSQVLASQDNLPLIVRRPTGFGQVVFLAADPSQEPLKSWSGSSALYQKIISTGVPRPGWADGFQNWTAAATAVSSLPNLNLPSTGLILGFLLLYVIAIGPVNYVLLRIFKRRELAWISIPALVIVFSLGTFLFGGVTRGSRPVLNQLAVVQAWPDREQARVDGLLGVFSPQRATYTLQVNPGFMVRELGDNSLSNQGELRFIKSENGATFIPDLRVDISNIRGVSLSGMIPAPAFTQDLVMNLDGTHASLEGQITNESDLRLSDVVLLAPGTSQAIGELSPHERINVQLPINSSGRATASGGGKGMITPSAIPAFAYPVGMYNDPTFTDLLGTSDFYSNPETYRRFNLLNAALNYDPNSNGRGSGVYLAGWSDSTPFEASLSGKDFNQSNTTLYLIALTPKLKTAGNRITFQPGFFVWSPLSNGSGAYTSPYDFELAPGFYAFQFNLSQNFDYRSVSALTFHLNSYGNSGPAGLQASLWNFDTERWEVQADIQWGDNSIAHADRYVGPGGEIRLKLENNSPSFSPVTVELADFTLEVTQ